MEDQGRNTGLKHLLDSEWLIVGGIFLVMTSLIIIAKIQACRNQLQLDQYPSLSHAPCIVRIEGAVKKPGAYEVHPGTCLRKILKKSSPVVYADLAEYDWDQRVETSMDIHIREMTEISIKVAREDGESIQYTVPAGTRVCDLKNYIDSEWVRKKNPFKGRRVLKNGERIVVNVD